MSRMTIDFNDKTTEMFNNLAKREGRTKVQILQRAIALYKYLHEQIKPFDPKSEREIAIVDREGNIIKIITFL